MMIEQMNMMEKERCYCDVFSYLTIRNENFDR